MTQADCSIIHLFSELPIDGEERAWRLLDHLLMSTLNTTFTLARVDHVAHSVSKNLGRSISEEILFPNSWTAPVFRCVARTDSIVR